MPGQDAEAVTAAVVGLEGVRGIFPDHPIGAIALTLVTAGEERATALIDVTRDGAQVELTARLAIDRAQPTAATLSRVMDAVLARFPGDDVRVSLEIAYID